MKGQIQFSKIIQQLAVACVLVLSGGVAMAHTGLKASMPADGSVVNAAPEAMHLTFTAAVALVRFTVTDQAGKQLELGFQPMADRKTDYHITMPAVPAGSYKVEWAVIGEDGHTVSNTFSYTVDPDATMEDHHAHEEGHQHNAQDHAAHGGDSHAH